MKKNTKILIIIGSTIMAILAIAYGYNIYQSMQNDGCKKLYHTNGNPKSMMTEKKPIIYLYPTEISDIHIQLNYDGKLTATYPNYDYSIKGRDVTAKPDGTLINKSDKKEYSYLFWEGQSDKRPSNNISEGFVVKGVDTKIFLQQKLSEIGLNPKEYNEFIVYRLPQMQNNKYNLIHFAGKDYTDIAPLEITPKPDSVLRVMMVFKNIDKPISIKPQTIRPFKRNGFSVVEWGGTEIK